MIDRKNVYNVGKYWIDFENKKISYFAGRYGNDDEYHYLRLNTDAQFYEQVINIIKEEGRKEIREGIKELLQVKERM